MQKLKDLLSKGPGENYPVWFNSIAELLLNNYLIETSNNKYRFMEIEFYYHSLNHQDETTYGFAKNMGRLNERVKRHKMAQRNQLTWFIHYSGIDLVIGNQENPGGILIRTIQNTDTQEIIDGPLVVLLELMNQGITVEKESNSQFRLNLTPAEKPFNSEIKMATRIGINSGSYKDAAYNYSI